MSLELLGAEMVPSLATAPSLEAVRAGRAALRKGMRGEAVMYVRRVLTPSGGQIDDVFEQTTEDRVRNFQQNQGLSADGVITAPTLDLIEFVDGLPVADRMAVLSGARRIGGQTIKWQRVGLVAAGVAAVTGLALLLRRALR